jgi:hypothetical protein
MKREKLGEQINGDTPKEKQLEQWRRFWCHVVDFGTMLHADEWVCPVIQ